MKSRFVHAAALAASVGLAASLPAEIVVYTGTDTATLTGRPPTFRTVSAPTLVTAATTGPLLSPTAPFPASTFLNGRFTNAPTIVDGVTLATGNLVLVKNETPAGQNGIYRVTAAKTWDRWTSFDETSEITAGFTVQVAKGTANTGRVFKKDGATVTTVNTTAINFSAATNTDPTAAVVTVATTGVLLSPAAPFPASTFTAGTFTNAPTIIDGVTLATGNLVLVKDQTAASQNGIYRVTAAKTWTRWVEFDSVGEITLGFRAQVSGGFSSNGLTFETTAPVPTTVNDDDITFAAVTDGTLRQREIAAISTPVTVPIKHEFYLLRDLKTGGTAVIFYSSATTGQTALSQPFIWQYPPLEKKAFLSRTLGSNVMIHTFNNSATTSGGGYFVDIDYNGNEEQTFFPYVVIDSNDPFDLANVPRLLTPYEGDGRVQTFHGEFNRNKISPTATTSQEYETFTPGVGLGLGLPTTLGLGLGVSDTRALTVAKPLGTVANLVPSVPIGTLFTTKYSGFCHGYFSPADPATLQPENAFSGRTRVDHTLATVDSQAPNEPLTPSVTQFADAYVTGTLTLRLEVPLSKRTFAFVTLQQAMELVTGDLKKRLFLPVRETENLSATPDVYYNNITNGDFDYLQP